jgi:hypothetical protein
VLEKSFILISPLPIRRLLRLAAEF